jgi:hypothetical protein
MELSMLSNTRTENADQVQLKSPSKANAGRKEGAAAASAMVKKMLWGKHGSNLKLAIKMPKLPWQSAKPSTNTNWSELEALDNQNTQALRQKSASSANSSSPPPDLLTGPSLVFDEEPNLIDLPFDWSETRNLTLAETVMSPAKLVRPVVNPTGQSPGFGKQQQASGSGGPHRRRQQQVDGVLIDLSHSESEFSESDADTSIVTTIAELDPVKVSPLSDRMAAKRLTQESALAAAKATGHLVSIGDEPSVNQGGKANKKVLPPPAALKGQGARSKNLSYRATEPAAYSSPSHGRMADAERMLNATRSLNSTLNSTSKSTASIISTVLSLSLFPPPPHP